MRRALIVLTPLAVVFALTLWRIQGPAPLHETASAGDFSSARAMNVLHSLLPDSVPHPMASPANARVRDRIVAHLNSLGYETTIQRRFVCNAAAVCGNVENILARVPGARKADTVLLATHYDSVPSGPGASDDGMGVAATLEIARAIRGRSFRNPVAFLIDDGEEAGLLGAEAFVADEELARTVGVVINLENRGTFGPSNMFETSRGNRWLIRHLSKSIERPFASSFFYAVYNLLPNNTDVTVFKRQGLAAINFAAVRGVNWYHTPLDDIAHASPRTMQHHGENALAALRAFADADLGATSSDDATYFDVLGFFLVWWPQQWTLWLAVVSLVLLVVAARKTPPREMTFGVLTAFVAMLFALLGGSLVSGIARSRSEGINFAATPWPSVAAMWLIGIGAALLAAALFRKRAQPVPMLLGIGIVWHMIGIALALTIGGAAFFFVVPALALTITAWSRMDELWLTTVPSTCAAILMFPLGVLLYDALGGGLMVAIAVFIGTGATLAAPLFSRPRIALVAILLALISAGIATTFPPYTAQQPRHLSLAWVDDSAASSPQWIVDELTDPIRRAGQFAPRDNALTPWTREAAWVAPAPREPLPRVTMTGERTADGARIRLRSPRGATRLVLRVKGGKILRVNGVAPAPKPERWADTSKNEWQYAVANGVEEMVVDVAAKGRLEAVGSDTTFGLPPSGAGLLEARRASTAIPVHDGDVTITRTRLTM